jgi:hypothetical protein
VRDLLVGSFPYSEGIFEDLNKVLILQMEWEPGRAADDIVAEYAASAFGPAAAEPVVRAARLMESGLSHAVDVAAARQGAHGVAHRLAETSSADACLALLNRAQAGMPAEARRSWRWRLLLLRATLDAELRRSGGRPTELGEACFDELKTLYAADRAELSVCPPSRQALRRLSV